MLAAGANAIVQPGAWLDHSTLVYSAGDFLVAWDRTNDTVHTTTVNCESRITCVSAFPGTAVGSKSRVIAGTQNGDIWEYNSGTKLLSLRRAVTSLCATENGFVAGCADGTVTVYPQGTEITLKTGFYPMALAWCRGLLAVAGTSGSIWLVSLDGNIDVDRVEVPGHENWVRSLDFRTDGDDLLLASGSQDRYIRLWRATRHPAPPTTSLATKKHEVKPWTVEFEALLMGHDDWVVSLQWYGSSLLSASGDSSLIVWTQEDDDLWTPRDRLGDISIMGASTATGATGGFWTAMWLPAGDGIATVTRSGSWRLWSRSDGEDQWEPLTAISGHTKQVTDVSWLRSNLVLTTSLDQTTRLWMPTNTRLVEVSRPQIHGYNMITVAALDGWSFVSAGDEKTMRVFTMPQPISRLLQNVGALPVNEAVSEAETSTTAELPSGAGVPALGLSNKSSGDTDGEPGPELPPGIPREDHLQRLTLWPEVEKLYGHGYEVSTVAVSGKLIASCCKAVTAQHAVVRVYDRTTWQQLGTMSSHTLTVTRLRFNPSETLLLSVGRDRKWSLYDPEALTVTKDMPKAHSRILWDGAFIDDNTFVTAGRDKALKKWNTNGELLATAVFDAPITACDASSSVVVIGLENGRIFKLSLELNIDTAQELCTVPGRVNRMLLNSHGSLVIASDAVTYLQI